MNEYRKIYTRWYDNNELNIDKYRRELGEFKVIEQLLEDAWTDVFIGADKNGDIYLINGTEVCGYMGGISYNVKKIETLCLKG